LTQRYTNCIKKGHKSPEPDYCSFLHSSKATTCLFRSLWC